MTQHEQKMSNEDLLEIDLGLLFHDFFRSLMRFWWLPVVLAFLFGLTGLVRSARSYRPMYKAEASFTVETQDNSYLYTYYYDAQTASRMANTFPYLLDSDLLMDRVKSDLGVEYLNGTPSAHVIDNSNLFTLTVTSSDPQAAYDILLAIIDNYPTVASYVIGNTQLNMITAPTLPEDPYNSNNRLKATAIAAAIGVIISMIFIIVHAITRGTVRKESHIEDKLHTECLGVIPQVIQKKRSKVKKLNLSVQNKNVGEHFQESFRNLTLRVLKRSDTGVLLITSTCSGEGVSTTALNLAYTLAENNKNVLYIDADFSKMSRHSTCLENYLSNDMALFDLANQVTGTTLWTMGCSRPLSSQESASLATRLKQFISNAKDHMDYILIDAPACQNFERLAPVAELADGIIYVIKQDFSRINRIMNCFEDLNRYDAKLLGCVLNCVQSGLLGYGYGYGYGYNYNGYSYHYGGYGHRGRYGYGYGYGENHKDSRYSDK